MRPVSTVKLTPSTARNPPKFSDRSLTDNIGPFFISARDAERSIGPATSHSACQTLLGTRGARCYSAGREAVKAKGGDLSARYADPTRAGPSPLGRLKATLEGAHESAQAGVIGRVEAHLPAPRRGHDGDGQLGMGTHEHQALAARQPAQHVDLRWGQVRSIGDPDGAVLERMHGVLGDNREIVKAAVLPLRRARAADRRRLEVGDSCRGVKPFPTSNRSTPAGGSSRIQRNPRKAATPPGPAAAATRRVGG